MKVKILFIIFLSLFIKLLIHPSELRLQGMSGISKLGLYVVPDLWCDSFYINPAYAAGENEKIIIDTHNDFIFSFYGQKEDTEYESSTFGKQKENEEIKGYSLYPEISFGILVPIKNFTFGGNFSFNIYYREREEISHIEDDISTLDINETTKVDDHYFESDLLFSWKIHDSFNIGFALGIDTVLYSNYEWQNTTKEEFEVTGMDTTSESEILGKIPMDLYVKSSFGILVKKKKIRFSFAIPFVFNIKQDYPTSAYDEDASDWEYSEDSFYINNEIRSVFEFYITKIFSFRIPLILGYKYTYLKREYGDKDDFSDLEGDEFYLSRQHYIPFKTAFSVNTRINNKFFLFYGVDMNLSFNYYYDYYEDESDYDFDQEYINLDFGLFFGNEFTLLKWLTLRFGTSTYFFRYSYSKAYSKEHKFELILNTSFNLGVAFKPIDWFTIEINTNFLTSGFDHSNKIQDTDYFDFEKELENSNFSIEIDFGLVFNIDYRKKKKGSLDKNKENK